MTVFFIQAFVSALEGVDCLCNLQVDGIYICVTADKCTGMVKAPLPPPPQSHLIVIRFNRSRGVVVKLLVA